MPTIQIITHINAPPERCFDLARDIGFHTRSLAHTGERAVAGRTAGLIELGESVTWEGRHLGVRQRFTARVTQFDHPHFFRDEMTKGAFTSFTHDHHFEPQGTVTAMTDRVRFRSPFGPLGHIANQLFLTAYLRALLRGRCNAIKHEAEATSERTT